MKEDKSSRRERSYRSFLRSVGLPCEGYARGLESMCLTMAPKVIKKKRWVKTRPRASAHHAEERQGNVFEATRDDFFAEAFRLSPHPIGITELETGRCLEINDACLQTFGFRRDEVLGKTTLMLGIWPDPLDRARLIDRLRAQGAVRNLEVSTRVKNGALRHFLFSTNMITLKGKACILTIGTDITERKQAEEAFRQLNETLEQRVEERTTALRTMQARQQLLLTSTPVVLYACRANGDYAATFVSENVVEQLGYRPQDFTDCSDFWISHIHPDDRAYVSAGLTRIFEHGRHIHEYRFLHKDGTYRWLRDEVRLLRDEAGAPLELIGFQIDVSDQKRASEALREGEERFRLFIEHVPTAIAMFDRDMCYLGASRRWMEDYGLTGDILGRSHYDLISDFPAWWKEVHRRGLAGEILSKDEDRFIRSDGSVQWVTWNVRPWYSGGKVGGIVIATEDVTARVEATRALRESEERSDQVVRLASFGIFDHDHCTGNVSWSPVMREIYGVGPNEPASVEEYIKLIHPDDRAAVVAAMKLMHDSAGDDLNLMEHRVLRRDGVVRWVSFRSWTFFSLKGSERRPVRTLGVMIDITRRKQAEEALHRQQMQLEELTSKLLTAQEHERRRIARDLHDDVSQRLAALVLEVASIEHRPSVVPTEIAHALTTLRQGLEEVSDDVHSLAYRLHPSLLEHAGLRPAVEDHIQQVSRRTGLPIRLKIAGVPTDVPLDHATCLFRVIQESVQNVVKHAQATQVVVQLRGSSKGVGLSILDNGKGLNLNDVSTHEQGLGLSSMEERLRQLHGSFRIQSRPFQGTKVCAWVPFEMEVT